MFWERRNRTSPSLFSHQNSPSWFSYVAFTIAWKNGLLRLHKIISPPTSGDGLPPRHCQSTVTFQRSQLLTQRNHQTYGKWLKIINPFEYFHLCLCGDAYLYLAPSIKVSPGSSRKATAPSSLDKDGAKGSAGELCLLNRETARLFRKSKNPRVLKDLFDFST